MTTNYVLPRYGFWVLSLAAVLGPILSILLSVTIAKSNEAEAERKRMETVEQQQTEQRLRFCRLISSQIDVYDEAQTPVGREARTTWLREYQIQGCLPARNR